MATPFIRFPGGVVYIWTPDTNGLDADTAHLQQSKSSWIEGGAGRTVSQSQDIPARFGDNVGKFSARASGTNFAYSGTTSGAQGIPSVVAGQSYWMFAYAAAATALATTGQIRASWRDSGFGQISAPFVGPAVALNGSALTLVGGGPSVAPVGAVQVRYDIIYDHAGVATDGEALYFDAALISDTEVTDFIPSMDIRGTRFLSQDTNPSPITEAWVKGQDQRLGELYVGDLVQWAVHDGVDADAPIVAQALSADALRVVPL